jgi:hypothetical protein
MASPIITIGDALVTALRSATTAWPVRFEVERRYIVEADLKDLDYVTASVFPRELEKTLGTRTELYQRVGLNLAFQKHVPAGKSKDIVDPLLNLVDAVHDWLMAEAQDEIGGAVRLLGDDLPQVTLYTEEALRIHSEFRSVIILTFDYTTSR